MKNKHLSIPAFALMIVLAACNGESANTSTTTTDNTTVKAGDSSNAMNNTNQQTPPVTTTPLTREDSLFAVKAAEGGMMEVEASNVALQNTSNDRIKAFATMMVNDHGKANSELMSFASGRRMSLPSALPASKQKHIDEMKKMKGKAFDKHYVSMMMNDHKKDVAEFEKAAQNCADAELKGWASKTLPTLKMHRDSVMALGKMKM